MVPEQQASANPTQSSEVAMALKGCPKGGKGA